MSSAYDDMVAAMDNAANGLPAAAASKGGGLLSSLGGLAGGLGGVLSGGLGSALSGLMGGPDAALQPDNNTLDARQNLGLTFANAFQVGGKSNDLNSSPAATATAPADGARTATASATPSLLNNSAVWIIGAIFLGLVLLLSFGRRR